MKRFPLLVLALLLLVSTVGAEEVWEKSLGEEITAVATDEYGDRIFVGTESGMLYCYDSGGNVVWSVQLAVVGADPSILDIRADTEGHIWVRRGNDYLLRNAETGASVWSHESLDVATVDGSISNTGTVLGIWVGILDLKIPTGTAIYRSYAPYQYGAISGDATWMAVTKAADTNLYLYSVNVPPDDWIAPISYGGYSYGWQNRIAHTIAGSPDGALTNYPVEITVIRGAGSSAGSTLYAPDCHVDFADIRFTAADGVTQLPYYLESVVGSTATFLVNVPSIPASPGTTTIYIYWANPLVSTTTSDPDAQWIFYDDFEDGSINTSLWTVTTEGAGTVTETGGYLEIYASGVLADYAAVTGPTVSYPAPCQIIANVSFHEVPSYRERVRIPLIGGGDIGVFSDVVSGGQQLYWAGFTGYSTTMNTNQLLHAWWTPGGDATYTYGSDWNVTRSPAASSVSIAFVDGDAGYPYGGHTRIYDIGVTSYNSSAFFTRSWSAVESIVTLLDTETLTGTIIDIDTPETGDWVAVSTTTKTYIIQITDTGFGTAYSADRTGTPYAVAIANNGANLIEGRGILADIFRFDSVQTGTYTAGGPVRTVAVAQKNGLYAAAGSDDGKYYIFSKDESSSWYLLHASDSLSPVTALAMSWRGETLVVGRSDGHLVAFRAGVEEEEFPGTIRLLVYKDALPYTGARLVIEHGGTDQTWETATVIQTDDYGVASVQVRWGEYVRVTVGENELQRVILSNPSQAEYVFRIKGPDPLRTGAQYSSGYDPDTQRIYLHYDDTREKTHLVVYTITRSTDNTVVFQKEYTTLPVDDYYQIPAGWTNSSYRIQLTASGSPSFTNTWSQWVGADGVASLPADLDTYARMGIAFFLILFVAGLFSYLSGPQGAVVVSMFAGALVLWGWLPLSPTVIALCIVWAFLGLLGRTSGE